MDWSADDRISELEYRLDQKFQAMEKRVDALEGRRETKVKSVSIERFKPGEILHQKAVALLLKKGFTVESIKAEFSRFRNHAISVDRKCAGQNGWTKAFYNWMRKVG